jgi:hypothetical protein
MPTLPQLDTGGIDVTNTLGKIASMRHMALQNQNLQSQMEAREEQLPSMIEARESENALRQAQINAAKRKDLADKLTDMTKEVGIVEGHPNPLEAYTALRTKHPDLPDETYFLKQGAGGNPEWDKDKFYEYSSSGKRALNLALVPKEGESRTVIIANKKFDKTKPADANNPPAYKVHLTSKNGQLIPTPGVEPEPAVDVVAKEESSEKHQRRSEEHMSKMEKHAVTMEGIASKREGRAAEKDKKGKLKLQTTNEAGEAVQIMQDGTVRMMDKDTGDWETVTDPDKLKGIKKLSTDKSSGGNIAKLEKMLKGDQSVSPSPSKSGPASRAEAIAAFKKANPGRSDAEINTAVDKKFPGLK